MSLERPATTTSITVGADEPVELQVSRLVRYPIATTTETDSLIFTLVDTAGNSGKSRVGLQTDAASDLPVLQVQVPVEGGVIADTFRLSGVVLDDDATAEVTCQVNARNPDTLADGEHTVTVIGVDIGGAVSVPVTREFTISRSQPVSTDNGASFQRATGTDS